MGNNSITGVGHSIAELVRAWWRIGRVRISPVEGRLLRLRPPCVILIDDQPVEVLRHSAGQSDSAPSVQYDCVIQDKPAGLFVIWNGIRRPLSVVWIESGCVRELSEQDVEVFG